MKTLNILLTVALLSTVLSASADAQGGPGGRARGSGSGRSSAPPVETIAQVSKALLAKIKLEKPQDQALKELKTKFTAEEKETLRLASMVRGGGARGGSGPQTVTALEALNERYIAAARLVLTEPQRLKADSNLVVHAEKQVAAALKAARSRGPG